jgi:RNA polymerase sigma-70 factor (ECF subfamily)
VRTTCNVYARPGQRPYKAQSRIAIGTVVHRGRTRIRNARKRFEVTEEAKAALLRKFTEAVDARDEQTLRALFAPDATWTADGGGRAAAVPRPIVGAERIARLVLGLLERLHSDILTMELVEVNGETGLCLRVNGQITAVISILTDGERIHDVYAVVNPDKLVTLSQPPLSSVFAMEKRRNHDRTS